MRMHTKTFIPKVIPRFLNLAGLLTCVLRATFPSFLRKDSGNEEQTDIVSLQESTELTVAGTVPELHRIPF